MKSRRSLYSVLLLILKLTRVFCLSTGDERTYFDFPSLNETKTLTVQENETVSLTFRLRRGLFELPADFFTINIKSSCDERVVCGFTFLERECQQNPNHAACTCPTNDSFVFNHTFSRCDSGIWTWSGKDVNKQVVNSSLSFNIEYPPRVTSLTITDDKNLTTNLVTPGDSVDVKCVWDLDPPRVTSLTITDDKNLTTNLVTPGDWVDVKCVWDLGPPELSSNSSTWELEPGVRTDLDFKLRTHTAVNLECFLLKLYSPDVQSDHPTKENTKLDCLSKINVTGSPPDLTLIVHIENVTWQCEGQWRLNLTNDAGSGHLDFDMTVTSTTDDDPPNDHPKLNRDVVIAGLNIAGFILFMAIVVTVNIICARKGRSPTRRPRQPIEFDENDAEGEPIELRRLSRSSGGHMYDEVRGSSGGFVVPRPDRRQSPRVGSDGYMVPAPLTTSTRHTDATDQDSPPAASGAYMDMGQGSGAGGYVDMSQGRRSNQDQRPVDVATNSAQERNEVGRRKYDVSNYFDFPSLNETKTLTVEENETVSLTFRLRRGLFELPADFFTIDTQSSCDDRVLYPPRVTSLTITDDKNLTTNLVTPGDSVDVKCEWDLGNPPVYNASLTSTNRQMAYITTQNGNHANFRLNKVTRNDSGNIRCGVPGADVNRTTTLLVRCTTDDDPPNDHPKLNRDVVIAGLSIAGSILFMAIVVTVNIICARKGRRPTRRPRQPIELDANDAEGELIELRRLSRSSGGHMYDEVRGSSGGFVIPRPERRQSPRVGSDGYMVPTSLTTSTRHTDTTDEDSHPAASGAYMDMGQGSGAGGYVDMSQGQRSSQDQWPVDITTTAAQERNVKPVYENTT
ncbi:hypothetical protein BaRGS_00024558 [Batillaria attramentaria]|uniref:Ig-like domain-containing protein n=1 Tax=Batillaria attramentaria TaxID=370345 RepID=A0ABD0KAR8_9CAEN